MGMIALHFGYSSKYDFGDDSDIVMCPDYISNDLGTFQRKFDRWLSKKSNRHGYWVKDCFGGDALCFDGEAFVKWLNQFIIKQNEEQAYFIKRRVKPNDEEVELPNIKF